MADRDSQTVTVIAGPTASGKSGLALALAERLGGTVINADSMQVYRGLARLTDQPDSAAQARAPHRLYGFLDPAEPCSAGHWRDLALKEIDAALAGGSPPIVVGGTGLYLKALIEGIAPVPEIPETVRARVRERHGALGNEAFHAELAVRDAAAAAAIRPSDPQRMIRAAEVIEATGRSLIDWQGDPVEAAPRGLRFRTMLLMPARDILYRAIEARVERMAASGGLEEAMALADRGLASDPPAMKALGVAELAAAARGDGTLGDALTRLKTLTRNYAKRQITWFSGQMVTDFVFHTQFSESSEKDFFTKIL
jgi:tRNA dimethylallyltransferase